MTSQQAKKEEVGKRSARLANGMGCSDCVILRVHERVGLPAIPLQATDQLF